MVEQKVAWASNRPGFGTASFSCLFYSSLFLEIFILSSTFKMNAEFEKEREQKKKEQDRMKKECKLIRNNYRHTKNAPDKHTPV